MGLAYHLAEGPQARLPAAEFVLQLTDWIVSNPPRCGANWSCSMEVAIRAVNWLWGLKLFAGSPFLTPEFQRLINWSLYQHCLLYTSIGLPTASVLASSGFQVLGVDCKQGLVETINRGLVHIHEPGLHTLVQAAVHSGNLVATFEPDTADVFMLSLIHI